VRLKRLIIVALASVLAWTEASALTSTYGWPAAENDALFNSFKNYMKTLQVDIVGEPLYYMMQELLIECEATYKNGEPYAWVGQVSRFCNLVENMYGPAMGHPRVGTADKYAKIRKDILMLRDYPMHEMSVDDELSFPDAQKTAFNKFNSQWLNKKREEFFQRLASPRPTGDELQVMKVYSSGVVFRTKNKCIGMDIAYNEAFGTTAGIDKLSDALDALYVTHAHGDHFDETLIRSMINKGKPVVMTKNIVKMESPYAVVWEDSHLTKESINGAITVASMGAQTPTPCLCYLVEIDGWRFIHVGDNSVHDVEKELAKFDQADVVVSPIFQGLTTLFTNIRGANNPDNAQQFYLNIHENEFHHTINGRVSYKWMYSNSGSLGSTSAMYPCTLLLDNGENITLYK